MEPKAQDAPRDRTNEILSAISAIVDRIGALERTVEQRLGTVEQRFDRHERILNAIARNLLAPAEVVALGIVDARGTGGLSSLPAIHPVAAKPSRE